MNEAEFADALVRSDKRAGRCPFCGKPGWITGDSTWCVHYAGTFDTAGKLAPCYPFLDEEPFDRFAKAVIQTARLTATDREMTLVALSPKCRRLVTAALAYPHPIDFWQDFVPYDVLFVEADEAPCKTTYISLFVADLQREKQRLATMVQQALGEMPG